MLGFETRSKPYIVGIKMFSMPGILKQHIGYAAKAEGDTRPCGWSRGRAVLFLKRVYLLFVQRPGMVSTTVETETCPRPEVLPTSIHVIDQSRTPPN
jgi:hypothetical protein